MSELRTVVGMRTFLDQVPEDTSKTGPQTVRDTVKSCLAKFPNISMSPLLKADLLKPGFSPEHLAFTVLELDAEMGRLEKNAHAEVAKARRILKVPDSLQHRDLKLAAIHRNKHLAEGVKEAVKHGIVYFSLCVYTRCLL